AEPPEGSASPAATGEPSPSAPPPEAVPRWSVQVGVFGPTVTAAGGLIVAVADDRLQALDPATGAVAWEREAVVRAAVADGRLYTVDESIYPWALTALDAASGGVEWSRSTEFLPWQGPFACGELLCVGSEAVAALRADGGGQVWYAEVNPENGLVANDDIVVAAHAVLEGLDPRTGDTAWTYEMDTASSPSLGDGMVVACDAEGVVHAVRTEDGAAVWTRPTGSFGHRFLYGDGVLYAQAGGGDTLALRADTGEELWAVQSGGGEGDPYGTTNLLRPADGALYVCGTDRTAYALDLADGSTLWTWDAGETFTAPPVPLDGLVFVGTSDGRVHALEPATER
ncbi:PQQ-binding-like beta-propeller repeat protein, partial [Glycomyces tenuis]